MYQFNLMGLLRPSCVLAGSAIAIGLLVATPKAAAGGPCVPGWKPAIGQPGLSSNAWGMMVHDGSLYVVGQFTTAGGQTANRIARWDGSSWHPVGTGFDGQASAIALFNGEIHVSGGFSHAGGVPAHRFARWDGSQWHPIHGLSAWNVGVLQVYNDDLYVAGDIITAGGQLANNIVRWDGANWHTVGGGTDSTPDQWGNVFARVFAMTVFAGDLIVGGQFEFAGDQTVNRIARWDGEQWHPIGDGLEYSVHALIEYNGDLIAAGDMSDCAFCQGRVSRWVPDNPSAPFATGAWEPMGSILDRPVRDLVIYNGNLIAGGLFLSMNGKPLRLLAKWNDVIADWEEIDGGANETVHPVPSLTVMAVYDGDLVFSGVLNRLGPDNLVSNRVGAWTECPPADPCPGDLTGSGTVGVPDLLALLAAWGPNPGHPADLTGNGNVGVPDLLALLSLWGPCP